MQLPLFSTTISNAQFNVNTSENVCIKRESNDELADFKLEPINQEVANHFKSEEVDNKASVNLNKSSTDSSDQSVCIIDEESFTPKEKNNLFFRSGIQVADLTQDQVGNRTYSFLL